MPHRYFLTFVGGAKVKQLLYAESVSKKIGSKQILQNISLNLSGGNVYGFVGENGSGKTMLFRILSGLVKPTTGKVCLNRTEGSIGQEFTVKEIIKGDASLSVGNTAYVYQYFGFQEVDGHIEFMNTLNLMNPENDYLIFMDSSPLNAYQNEPAFILKSEFFGYIKTDHTDTLTLEGNYRDYNFSDLANYEFFSTSESVTKTLNYIRSELLKKFT